MRAKSFLKCLALCGVFLFSTTHLFAETPSIDDTARFRLSPEASVISQKKKREKAPGGAIILDNSIVPGGLEQKVLSLQEFKSLTDLRKGDAKAIYSSSYFDEVFQSPLRSSITPTVSSGFPYTEMAMLPGEGCTDVSVELLATEITWGSQGPDVPLLIDWETEGNVRTELFGGDNLQERNIGDTDGPRPLLGGEIDWFGRSAYPNFQDPIFSMEVPSADANNAAILINGSNLYEIAAAKGIQDPFGGQLALEQVLQAHIEEQTGDVSLGMNEMLVLYELGTYNQQSQTFDFQDLVVMVKFNPECVVMEVNHLRKDEFQTTASCWDEQTPECTDGRIEIPSYATVNWSSYVVGGAYLNVNGPTVITDIAGIAVGDMDFEVSELVPLLRIYSSESGFGADPSVGDVYSTDDVGIDLPVPFGGTSQTQGLPYSYVRLTFEPFVLPGPGTYIVSIIHQEPNVDNFHWAHTTTDLGSDIITTNAMHPNYELIETVSGPPGTLAIDVKGYLLP